MACCLGARVPARLREARAPGDRWQRAGQSLPGIGEMWGYGAFEFCAHGAAAMCNIGPTAKERGVPSIKLALRRPRALNPAAPR